MKAAGYDLVVVGGGSAGFAAAIRAHELGARVAMVNAGSIGGTCVNVGCVPSKFLIAAAEGVHRAHRLPYAGLQAKGRVADFRSLVRQKEELLSTLRQSKYAEVLEGLPRVTLVAGRARLLDPRTVVVGEAGQNESEGEQVLRGEALLIATGASPRVPAIPGLAGIPFLTSQEALSLPEVPESLVVLGGGYVALELGQMLARFGARVTILVRGDHVLRRETATVAETLTTYLRQEGIEIVTGAAVRAVRQQGGLVEVEATVAGKPTTFVGTHLLVATGRVPNTGGLGLEEAGVELDPAGGIRVDENLETSRKGVFAAGDVIRPFFVYAAAYEGALAAENALTGRRRPRDYTGLPWVIFTDPQVAGVGPDEEEARQAGIDAEAATLPLELVARCQVTRDTRGFIRLIRDRATDRLVGARVIAPGGGELVGEIGLAIRHGLTTGDLAAAFHPYLTLSEGLRLAALQFTKNVTRLSCCAG